jgi:hypothetical protein
VTISTPKPISQKKSQKSLNWQYLTEAEIGQAEAKAIKLGKPFDVNFARQIEEISRSKNSGFRPTIDTKPA